MFFKKSQNLTHIRMEMLLCSSTKSAQGLRPQADYCYVSQIKFLLCLSIFNKIVASHFFWLLQAHNLQN